MLRAAGAIAQDRQIVVIGSQAILGQFPDAPAELRMSMEADVYPRNLPQRAELIDGSIGEGSFFHQQFGYYAQGVGPETARLPEGWKTRLVLVSNPNTGGIEGLCLDVHDLAVSKYVAGRDKDLSFTRELARHRMTDRDTLLVRLRATPLEPAVAKLVKGRIERDFPAASRGRRRGS